ncbi:hypothetical protein [Sphingosinicella sp. BN140058]|uniref:hypothetical protein n=1 Tax=Sphingosinicella sp. BN140058 TaxID=1892855 RepID=UPI00197E257F|nr:hypothetical protein [Sphingosinicella sp. BN140058]
MASLPQPTKIDIGRVIQGGVSAIEANAPAYFLASLLLAGIPTFLVYFLVDQGVESFSVAAITLAVVSGFVTFVSTYLLQAALTRSAILTLSGSPADVRGSVIASLRMVLPMIGLAILSGLGIVAGLALLIVPGIMLYVAWAVAVPVLVHERTGIVESLSRSAELTKGSRWMIFALLLLYLFASAAFEAMVARMGTADLQSPLTTALLNGFSAAVTTLIGAAMLASLYLELRMVKEGASTDELAAIFA